MLALVNLLNDILLQQSLECFILSLGFRILDQIRNLVTMTHGGVTVELRIVKVGLATVATFVGPICSINEIKVSSLEYRSNLLCMFPQMSVHLREYLRIVVAGLRPSLGT